MATANEERQTALDKLISQEVEKTRQAEAEQQRREAESEALNKQVQSANEAFEAEKIQLAAKMNYLLRTQKSWRSRFEFLLSEIDSLSDDQTQIQNEIAKLRTATENLVYRSQQAGALVGNVQLTWDDLGGANEALSPWPEGVSNSVALANAKWQNYVARWIFAKSTYQPKLRLDGRRR